jgi:hypothetical protein
MKQADRSPIEFLLAFLDSLFMTRPEAMASHMTDGGDLGLSLKRK